MICSIHQPQSFPWLGFFAKIYQSDVFILLDNVQFKKNEFQNRNKIKINEEGKWFTIPVKYKFGQLIYDIEINQLANWKDKHMKTLQNFYAKTEYFGKYFPELEKIYTKNHTKLSTFNIEFIDWTLEKLEITTKILIASEMINVEEIENDSATEKLIKLVKLAGCDVYLSGSGGKSYLDEDSMKQKGIDVIYQHYTHPEYSQMGNEFIPYLSVLDLLFNKGPKSLSIIKKGIK